MVVKRLLRVVEVSMAIIFTSIGSSAQIAVGPSSLLPKMAERNDFRRVKELLSRGEWVNAKDKYGWTALMWAARNNNREMAELLLRKGANVRYRDEDGDTALINAVLNDANKQDLRLIRVLLRSGANPLERNRKGFSALSIAKQARGQRPLVRLMQAHHHVNVPPIKEHMASQRAAHRAIEESALLLVVFERNSGSVGQRFVGMEAGDGTISDVEPGLLCRLRLTNPAVQNASELSKLTANESFVLDTVTRPVWKSDNVATIHCTQNTGSGGFGRSPHTYALKNGRWVNIDKTGRVSCGVWQWLTINGKRILPRKRMCAQSGLEFPCGENFGGNCWSLIINSRRVESGIVAESD